MSKGFFIGFVTPPQRLLFLEGSFVNILILYIGGIFEIKFVFYQKYHTLFE